MYYHFVLLGTPVVPAVTEKDVFEMTRKTYDGPLLIGEDLIAFRVGRDQVVELPPREAQRPAAGVATMEPSVFGTVS